MNDMLPFTADAARADVGVFNLSRRGFLGASLGGLMLGVSLPVDHARAQVGPEIVPGTRVNAFIEVRPDSTVFFRSPFIEGGQGIYTAMAQIVGEELDVHPSQFVVEAAPAGRDYQVVNGSRVTGGSQSIRRGYDTMRKLGASGRLMLLQAGADRLGVPVSELSTEPGIVLHRASGRSVAYGEIAAAAAALPLPTDIVLRKPADFRWIGKPLPRLDVRDKSTGKVQYAIDIRIDGMLYGAVQHGRRRGMEPDALLNEAEVSAMLGVHSVHRLPGAVAVLANSWWRARRAVETLQATWTEPAPGTPGAMPADFSSKGRTDALKSTAGDGIAFETVGDVAAGMSGAAKIIEATFDAPYLAHAQLEPPSTLARWNDDGTLELWMPNQAPEMFRDDAAKVASIAAEKIIIHSPMLGGFFGRHFIYTVASAYPHAILLAKASNRPVKLVWTREEEFLRDAMRPMSVARLRAGLDANGFPVALQAVSLGEGALSRWFGRQPGKADRTAVEGLAGKSYAIPNRRIGHIHVDDPAVIGFWRSVGHSSNDYFYETFLDEIADVGKHDPYELRRHLLASSPRHLKLLEAVGDLSGGWKRGPYTAADGSRRARGVAMASPFGTEVATIAEVSLQDGVVKVHDVWVAIDPGSIVNPAVIEAQVASAVAIGLSSALLEEVVYENGVPRARNYDGYPILPPDRMPKVHVHILASGAPMGGIGEPGVPGVPPAVVNAVSVLTGQRIRSLPLSKTDLSRAAG